RRKEVVVAPTPETVAFDAPRTEREIGIRAVVAHGRPSFRVFIHGFYGLSAKNIRGFCDPGGAGAVPCGGAQVAARTFRRRHLAPAPQEPQAEAPRQASSCHKAVVSSLSKRSVAAFPSAAGVPLPSSSERSRRGWS